MSIVSDLNLCVDCFTILSSFFFIIWIEAPSVQFVFRHPSPSVLIPALRTVGNIVTGDDVQTQV